MATVQILMAVYNGESFLSAQVDSILSQTYGDWELLISDDCSTDDSLKVIRDYCSRDSRIKIVLEGKRCGSAKKHFMALFRQADAPYVMTCDQDDVWDPDKIEITLKAMQDHQKGNQPLLVCTDLRVVDRDLNEISPSFLAYSGMDAGKLTLGYFLASCLVTGCTMMANKPLLEMLQVPCDDDALVMHDWWASLIAAAFGEVIHLNRATISYRQHGDNSVGADRFTPRRALAALDLKRETEKAAIAQVAEFKQCFQSCLSKAQLTQVDAFIAIGKASPFERIFLMNKADIWRHGLLRNAGTLFVLATLAK